MHKIQHKKEKIIIGIDPGKKGAVAILDNCGNCIDLFELPYLDTLDINTLNLHLTSDINLLDDVLVILEKPAVTSAKLKKPDGKNFNIGLGQVRTTFLNYGKLICFFELSDCKIKEISPQSWKNKFNLDKTDKKKSVELALKLFPEQRDKLIGPQGGLKDGLAEALLITEYGRLLYCK